jgi:hypothetical protein
MAKAGRTLRDLRIAARDGDHAMRALLRRYGWPQLADEVRRNKPITAPIEGDPCIDCRRRHAR